VIAAAHTAPDNAAAAANPTRSPDERPAAPAATTTEPSPMNDIHRSFSTLVSDLEDGHLHADLSREVQDIVGELNNAFANVGGKPKASLTLKLDFTLEDGGIITIAADTKKVLPRTVRARTFMYATPENNLTRRNPRQPELPLHDVNSEREPARTV
jgi:hypothetical protein